MDLLGVLIFCALLAFSTEDGRSLILGEDPTILKCPFRVSSYRTGVLLFSTTKENDTGLLFRHIIDKDSAFTVGQFHNKLPPLRSTLEVLIIETFDYYSLNVSAAIYRYKYSKFWTSETKVILLMNHNQIMSTIKYTSLFSAFSAVGLINLAILQILPGGRFLFAYHNPFPAVSPSVTYLYDPTDWTQAFPNKIRNLRGHQVNLNAIAKPPGIILVKGHPSLIIRGIQASFFEAVMRHWNGTFRYTQLNYLRRTPNTSLLNELYVNRYPFFSYVVNRKFDLVPAHENDQVLILVRHQTANLNIGYFLVRYLFNPFGILLLCVYVTYFTLHYFLFHRDMALCCRRGFSLIPIALRQPAHITARTDKERIYITAGLCFALFLVAAFECQFTSNLIINKPKKKITRVSQLVQENYKIFSDIFVATQISFDHYNLSSEFLRHVQVADEWPWTPKGWGDNYAFLISLQDHKFFLKSPFNMDQFGNERFYLLDYIVTTTPMVYVLPKNSPYRMEFTKTTTQMLEAGLREYWQTKTLREHTCYKWYSNMQEQRNDEIRFVFSGQAKVAYIVILCGWTFSIIGLLAEMFNARFGRRIRNGIQNRLRKKRGIKARKIIVAKK